MFKIELDVQDLNLVGAGLRKLAEPVTDVLAKIQSQLDAQLPQKTVAAGSYIDDEMKKAEPKAEDEGTNRIPGPAQLIESAKKKAARKAA